MAPLGRPTDFATFPIGHAPSFLLLTLLVIFCLFLGAQAMKASNSKKTGGRPPKCWKCLTCGPGTAQKPIIFTSKYDYDSHMNMHYREIVYKIPAIVAPTVITRPQQLYKCSIRTLGRFLNRQKDPDNRNEKFGFTKLKLNYFEQFKAAYTGVLVSTLDFDFDAVQMQNALDEETVAGRKNILENSPWEIKDVLNHFPEWARNHSDVTDYLVQWTAIDPDTGSNFLLELPVKSFSNENPSRPDRRNFDDFVHTGGAKFLKASRYWDRMALNEVEVNSQLYNHPQWPCDLDSRKYTTRGDGEEFDHVSLDWNAWYARNINNYKPDAKALKRQKAADKLDAEESGVDKLFLTARCNFYKT